MKSTMLAAAILAAVVLSVDALGAPVEWTTASGGNGHYYEAVAFTPGTNWDDAKDAAALSTHLGQTGHLATIGSQAENDFVQTVMGGVLGDGVIGGYQPAGSPEPSDNWQWVTGESWSYDNWRSGEPNNANSNENVLKIFASSGQWNDVPDSNYVDGYVVEYVPEPACLGLLAFGGLAVFRRRGR